MNSFNFVERWSPGWKRYRSDASIVCKRTKRTLDKTLVYTKTFILLLIFIPTLQSHIFSEPSKFAAKNKTHIL